MSGIGDALGDALVRPGAVVMHLVLGKDRGADAVLLQYSTQGR